MNLLRRALAPLLALLIAMPASAAPALWRFGDQDTTIYLFGTIHALPPNFRWNDARISRAMARSDTLVVETVIEKDPMAIARLYPPPDPNLPPIVERVPAKDRKALAALLKRSGLNQDSLDRMPTWQAAFLLMGTMMKDLGIAREAGVESSISRQFEMATDGRPSRKIEGLETPASQLALFSNLAEADQRDLLASMIAGRNDARTDYAKLLAAWASGNQLAIARAFADDADLPPHLREVLLRQRNAAWTKWLKARLDTPGTVFVAVGAGHLAGPMSLQTMLRAEGIAVQRIYANPARRNAPPTRRPPGGSTR